eukprot:NODE_42_length_34079_cov_0.552619.p9 type:complete len:218 gc:universal NODE_42_length_34079_cov_0.552619:11311-10658(-)
MAVTRSQSKNRQAKNEVLLFKSSPLSIIFYSLKYIARLIFKYLYFFAMLIGLVYLLYCSNNPILDPIKFNFYWFLLGVASSIGFGSGLHTFLLYLGPHIVHVTHFAQRCGVTDEISRNLYYGLELSCSKNSSPSIFEIFYSVSLNTFFWGAGTAIGELPPYFIAKTDHKAKEELQAIRKLLKSKKRTNSELLKVKLYELMQNYGFWGILLCASVTKY